MDLKALPLDEKFTLDRWHDAIKEHGIVFYDSSLEGEAPYYKEDNADIKLADVKEEAMMEELKQILEDDKKEYGSFFDKPETVPENPNQGEELDIGVLNTNTDTDNLITNADSNQGTITISNGISWRNAITVDNHISSVTTHSPLTDQEVDQLEIIDPRGEAPATPSLTTEENDMIDAVMNASSTVIGETPMSENTVSRRIRRRARRLNDTEPGFNLIDDTDE